MAPTRTDGAEGRGSVAADIRSIRSKFRRLDPNDYPELADYSWEQIYGDGDSMAPGGLYLAARMARSLHLNSGDIVFDLGCGHGDSSIFLAKHFGVTVVCFDLWISSTSLSRKIELSECRQSVFPLDLDATDVLPFPNDYFDAMFCMQSLHSFGGDANVLRRLIGHLKPGGAFVVGGTCFNEEPANGQLPDRFSYTDGWDAEYEKYHSPSWWSDVFEQTRLLDVMECTELRDGRVMWEDGVAYHGQRAGWTDEWYDKSEWLIDQLVNGRDRRPYLTHYVATTQKKDWSVVSKRRKDS